MEAEESIADCVDLRQGDVVALPWMPVAVDGAVAEQATPLGVVLLSQTCDIVQPSKTHCLVAPIVEADPGSVAAAKKGRSPLKLHLVSAEPSEELVADMGLAVSVPKSGLIGLTLSRRTVSEESSADARLLGHRIGRAFNRFPFPDAVYPAFAKLRSKVQSSAGGRGAFGKVVDLVEDLRVSADQWMSAGRRLTLYVVISTAYLIPADEADPDWEPDPAHVAGLKRNEIFAGMSLTRLSELIIENLEGDATTRLRLWDVWIGALKRELLDPALDDEVVDFDIVLLTDEEFTLATWKRTESLDLEVLSSSSLPTGAPGSG